MKISGSQSLPTNYEHLMTKSKQYLFLYGQKIHFNFNLQQRENGKHFQATKGCPILVATRVSGYVGWPGDETVASQQVRNLICVSFPNS